MRRKGDHVHFTGISTTTGTVLFLVIPLSSIIFFVFFHFFCIVSAFFTSIIFVCSAEVARSPSFTQSMETKLLSLVDRRNGDLWRTTRGFVIVVIVVFSIVAIIISVDCIIGALYIAVTPTVVIVDVLNTVCFIVNAIGIVFVIVNVIVFVIVAIVKDAEVFVPGQRGVFDVDDGVRQKMSFSNVCFSVGDIRKGRVGMMEKFHVDPIRSVSFVQKKQRRE